MNKIYQAIKKELPTEAVDIKTAVALLKKHTRESFDETVELAIRLGVNPAKSDQMVRATVVLPGGAAKAKKIVVFTSDALQQKAALAEGAILAGGEELIALVASEGKLEADLTVATPDLMPGLAKVARILGPKGLMPNPKTGTVAADPVPVLKELLGGRLSFKMDKLGNIHEVVGKASWAADRLESNIKALLVALKAARPTTMKGQLIKTATISTTMGPGIRIMAA